MADAPQRVQLSRKAGSRLPPNTVKVDRTSKLLGNPFKPVDPKNLNHVRAAVDYYRRYLEAPGWGEFKCGPEAGVMLAFVPEWSHARAVLDVLPQLRGRNLACWCPIGAPCHGDVLLDLANREEPANG